MAHWSDEDLSGSEKELLRKTRPSKPYSIKCEECGQNYVEARGDICEGCDAYREHTGHF